VIFVATCLAAQTTSLVAVDVLMVACCANAVLVLLQALKIWNPFPVSYYAGVALLGVATAGWIGEVRYDLGGDRRDG